MKTPTLIIRLLGLYLLVVGILGLVQTHRMSGMSETLSSFGIKESDLMGDGRLDNWIGVVLGLAATLFAGPIARVLTFDSEPKAPRL